MGEGVFHKMVADQKVIGNDFRHPAVLAREVAILDMLSGGRIELGLGAAFLRRDYAAAGLPLDEPRDRVGRLEEALRLLKALFGPDPVTTMVSTPAPPGSSRACAAGATSLRRKCSGCLPSS